MILAHIVPVALATLISWLGTAAMARRGNRLVPHASVNERSLHTVETPQGGGLAIVVAASVALLWQAFWSGGVPWGLASIAAIAAVVLISLADDFLQIRRTLRLAIHTLAGSAMAIDGFTLTGLHSPYWGPVEWAPSIAFGVTALILTWTINLWNFMDGMDGLCAGVTALGLAGLALVACSGPAPMDYSVSAMIVSGACLGFLAWNFPPARIFLGDVGAAPLGLIVGLFALWGIRSEAFDAWVPLLIFAPLWLDASFTLVTRILRGERFWEAHRMHVYQRLVRGGWSQRRTTLVEYGLTIFGISLALLLQVSDDDRSRALILLVFVGTYVVLTNWALRSIAHPTEGGP